jgi:hypothetical protein
MVLKSQKELLPVFLVLSKIKFRHRRKLKKRKDHTNTLRGDFSAKARSETVRNVTTEQHFEGHYRKIAKK